MNRTFFTADTHFGHRGIIKHAGRLHDTVEEMNNHIIAVWNAIVPENADVWHLGDFAWDVDILRSVVPRLNGRLNVLWGNHDDYKCRKSGCLLGMTDHGDYAEIKLSGQHITLCHYPMRVWNRSSKGAWMLHGHCHGNLADYSAGRGPLEECGPAKTMDVGWDCWGKPMEFTEIAELMKTRKDLVVDHHGI